MKESRKDRRGKRVPATHRLLITILGPTGGEISKEIVSTVEVSQHGARVRGRRTLRPDSQGLLTQLSSGRQAPFRVAWQQKSSEPNAIDTGVELLSTFDFWGAIFSDSSIQPVPAAAPVESAVESGSPPISPAELLDELRKAAQSSSSDQKTRVLEAVWCALIEQLEERQVFTREELLTAIRSVAVPTRVTLKASEAK
jgi:hypothetical protein